MILLDSNVIIYLRDPRWGQIILDRIGNKSLDTCNIVVSEVLGFKGLEKADAQYFEQLFSTMKNHLFNEGVTRKVIELRKTRPIQLPDAIIAATALTNGLTLWTHNIEDFEGVPELHLLDPLVTK